MTNNMIHDIEVGDREKETVSICPEAIQEEFVRLPADLAYWNAKYGRALKAFLTAKAGEKKLEALVYIQQRERLIEEGSKPTEKMIDAAVQTNKTLVEARDLLIETEVEKARVWGVLDAVRSKKEMLISLGAHLRQEMDGDPMVRAAHADARRARDNSR